MQSNHPKYFLLEEEFLQLRHELSKTSLSAMVGEDGEPSVAQEELPPGTEDLADPAKVYIFKIIRKDTLTKFCMQV